MKRKATRQQGFTFVELAVTLVVLAIAAGYAIPAYQDLSANSAVRSTTMSLVAAINEARGQSLGYHKDYTLKATDGSSWSNGWTVTDGTESRTWSAANAKNTVVTDPSTTKSIVFQSNGFIDTAKVTFTICDDRTGEKGSKVTLGKNGKVENADVTCS